SPAPGSVGTIARLCCPAGGVACVHSTGSGPTPKSSRGDVGGEQHAFDDADHFGDCTDPEVARRIHQHCDCVVRVEDRAGAGVGWGPMQTIAIGGFPEFGLTLESTFV